MKKIILLLALFMLFKPALPVLDYIINFEYISTVLCENKAKPKMNCNGKCHLMKELAKSSENEKPISSNKKIAAQEFEVLFIEIHNSFQIKTNFFDSKLPINTHYSNLYNYLNSTSVFQPPTIIS